MTPPQASCVSYGSCEPRRVSRNDAQELHSAACQGAEGALYRTLDHVVADERGTYTARAWSDRRGGPAADQATAALPGHPPQRRLHTDGVCGGCTRAHIRNGSHDGDPRDARGTHPGQGRVWRVYV